MPTKPTKVKWYTRAEQERNVFRWITVPLAVLMSVCYLPMLSWKEIIATIIGLGLIVAFCWFWPSKDALEEEPTLQADKAFSRLDSRPHKPLTALNRTLRGFTLIELCIIIAILVVVLWVLFNASMKFIVWSFVITFILTVAVSTGKRRSG